MQIIKIQYARDNPNTVTINDDGKWYPVTHNIVQEWVSSGNTISEYQETIEELKKRKALEVKELRRVEQYSPFIYTNANGTYTLPNTEKAKTRYIGKHQAWNGAATKKWFDVKGVGVDFTKGDFKEILKIIEANEDIIYEKAFTISLELNAITNLIELQAYNVQEKWDQL